MGSVLKLLLNNVIEEESKKMEVNLTSADQIWMSILFPIDLLKMYRVGFLTRSRECTRGSPGLGVITLCRFGGEIFG